MIYIHLVAQGKKELLNGYWAWDRGNNISCKFAVLSDGDWIACQKNWVLGLAKLCFVSLFLCMTIIVYIFPLMIDLAECLDLSEVVTKSR